MLLFFSLLVLPILYLADIARPDDYKRSSNLTVGYKGGLAISNMAGESAGEFKLSPRIGPAVGGLLIYPIHAGLEMQAELLFSIKGLKRTYEIPSPDGPVTFDETASLYFLELPFLVRFPFPTEGQSKVTTYGGVTAGAVLSGSASGEYSTQSDSLFSDGTYDGGITNYRRFDFGFILGGEIQFAVGSLTGLVDLRYTYGLVNIFEDVAVPVDLSGDEIPFADFLTGEGIELRNGSFTISFGIISRL